MRPLVEAYLLLVRERKRLEQRIEDVEDEMQELLAEMPQENLNYLVMLEAAK